MMNSKSLFAVFLLVTGFVDVYSVMPTTLDEALLQKRTMDEGMMTTMEQPEAVVDQTEAPTAKVRHCSGLRCLTDPPYPVHPLPAGFEAYTDFEGI